MFQFVSEEDEVKLKVNARHECYEKGKQGWSHTRYSYGITTERKGSRESKC